MLRPIYASFVDMKGSIVEKVFYKIKIVQGDTVWFFKMIELSKQTIHWKTRFYRYFSKTIH